MEQIIFHIDVNSAFLSWEAAYRIHHLNGRLDLRTIPAAASGNKKSRHGIILAKSIPAKKFGIQTGMPVTDALKKCPHLYCVPPNYGLYQKCSHAFMDILHDYTSEVEQYSIDESFLDMSNSWKLFGNTPYEVALIIKNRIEKELGFTVNIGISSNKLLAKMAGEFNKPNNANTIFPCEIEKKMWPLPVRELFFVGRATSKKLDKLGIKTIGELAKTDPLLLKEHLKKQGEIVWAFANGIDFSNVETTEPPQKGYGNSTTISFDVADSDTAKLVLLALSETVASRLRKDNMKAELISLGIKSFDLNYMSHQKIMPTATNITKEIYKYSCELFDEAWKGLPIRHLGIHTSRLRDYDCARQLNLFDNTDYVKLEALDFTIDSIRGRFGIDSLKRASFIDNEKIDHVSGCKIRLIGAPILLETV